MEVKPGYKQTECGIIPQDWKTAYLGDVADIRMCKRIFAEQTRATGDIPFFKIGTFGGVPDAFIPFTLYAEYRRKYSFPRKGDILLSAAGTLGKTVVYDGQDAYFQDSNIVWLEVDDQKIINEYLYHCYEQIEWASPEGSTIARLYNGIIRATRIRLPPLAEQQAIAQALSDIDDLIQSLERLIAKKRGLKQAAMQQLLTGQTRLPGFSGEWNVSSLRQHLFQNATYGVVKAGSFQRSGVPMLRGGDIKNGRVSDDQPLITEEKSREYARTILREGDVVIALVGYPGESAVVPSRLAGANISRAVGLLRPAPTLLPSFLTCYLNSPSGRREFLRPSAGSAQIVVNLGALNNLPLLLPSAPEQAAIAEVLSDMDAEITALEARLAKTRDLKQGMMQELLTGRTRLV